MYGWTDFYGSALEHAGFVLDGYVENRVVTDLPQDCLLGNSCFEIACRHIQEHICLQALYAGHKRVIKLWNGVCRLRWSGSTMPREDETCNDAQSAVHRLPPQQIKRA